jgi:hypothetical protein
MKAATIVSWVGAVFMAQRLLTIPGTHHRKSGIELTVAASLLIPQRNSEFPSAQHTGFGASGPRDRKSVLEN